MLAAAGYPNGFAVKDVYRNAGDHPAVAQDIHADLKACSIEDQLVPVNQRNYYGKYLNSPSAASAASGTSASRAGTATTAARSSSRCSTAVTAGPLVDYGDYNNPAVKALIDKALAAPDQNTAATTGTRPTCRS
jgi:ABC-type transport system substrate-binding protein